MAALALAAARRASATSMATTLLRAIRGRGGSVELQGARCGGLWHEPHLRRLQHQHHLQQEELLRRPLRGPPPRTPLQLVRGMHTEEASLSVSQIKQVLDAAGVDYRDCLEKAELERRLQEARPRLPPRALALLSRLAEAQLQRGSGADADLGRAAAATAAAAYVSERGLLLDEENTVALFQRCAPSVAFISTFNRQSAALSLNIFEIPRGTGTGFVWDDRGHIVTNYHVIKDSSRASVSLNGESYDAELVGYEADKDLAVLRIQPKAVADLVPIVIGSSHNLLVGQRVFAIGNPFGLDRTLTTGIISAVNRDIKSITGRSIRGVIQSDAAINPGNSGGPLLDSNGRLIGVNTMIYSPSGASAGVGFAIPVDTVLRVVNQLIRFGRVRRPGLGLSVAQDAQARELGVTDGVLLLEVSEGSGSHKAGLRSSYMRGGRVVLGDVITRVQGQRVQNVEDLLAVTETQEIGDRVTLEVRRGGQTVTVSVELTEIK